MVDWWSLSGLEQVLRRNAFRWGPEDSDTRLLVPCAHYSFIISVPGCIVHGNNPGYVYLYTYIERIRSPVLCVRR